MASKINKKMNVSVEGILDLTNGDIKLEVQDVEGTVLLSDLISEFSDKTVKITVAHATEM